MSHLPGQRGHEPPPALAGRRASASDLAKLNHRRRQYRTCVHCGTVYKTVPDADACEALYDQGQ